MLNHVNTVVEPVLWKLNSLLLLTFKHMNYMLTSFLHLKCCLRIADIVFHCTVVEMCVGMPTQSNHDC